MAVHLPEYPGLTVTALAGEDLGAGLGVETVGPEGHRVAPLGTAGAVIDGVTGESAEAGWPVRLVTSGWKLCAAAAGAVIAAGDELTVELGGRWRPAAVGERVQGKAKSTTSGTEDEAVLVDLLRPGYLKTD